MASALAPASNVRATTFDLVGRVNHCAPLSELGMPGSVGGRPGFVVGEASGEEDGDGVGSDAPGERVTGTSEPAHAAPRTATRRMAETLDRTAPHFTTAMLGCRRNRLYTPA